MPQILRAIPSNNQVQCGKSFRVSAKHERQPAVSQIILHAPSEDYAAEQTVRSIQRGFDVQRQVQYLNASGQDHNSAAATRRHVLSDLVQRCSQLINPNWQERQFNAHN